MKRTGVSWSSLSAASIDLIVLDIMLPGRNRARGSAGVAPPGTDPPVLMLTARGDDVDRIPGPELGADDYLPKPFDPRESWPRACSAILRRAREPGSAAGTPISQPGPITVDPSRHYRTEVRGAVVVLTGAEMRVLEQLMRHAGKVTFTSSSPNRRSAASARALRSQHRHM